VASEWNALSIRTLTIHGITFCGFSINTVYDSKKELRTSRLTLKFPHCGTNDEM